MELNLISLVLYKIARNWIAGKSIADAIRDSKAANSKCLSAILNYLGEEISDKREVEKSAKEYKNLLVSIKINEVDGSISVKLTQLGLNIDKTYCRNNLVAIVKHAAKMKSFVWIDMESSKFTSDTVDIYSSVFSKYRNIGICIQSYLRRSKADIDRLVKIGGKIRLVKGAYNESSRVAYKSRKEVRENYSKLMKFLFRNSRNLFSIATHDDDLIEKAMRLNDVYHRNFEFGMLKGIRDSLKLELLEKGYRVTEYIPYGKNWLPYSIRRIKEKPSNILLLLRSLIGK